MSRISTLIDNSGTSNNITYTVPANRVWKILFGSLLFTSSSTPGNRIVSLTVRDLANNILAPNRANIDHIESLVMEYSIAAGYLSPLAGSTQTDLLILPVDLLVLPGWTITAGDFNDVDAGVDVINSLSIVYKDMSLSESSKL